MDIKRLDLKVGFACNNNCRCCPQAHRKHLGDQTLDEIKKELEDGRKTGCNEVVLTGGEPTVRKDLFDIIKYAKSLGYDYIQLQTNGRMMYYKDFCKKLIKYGVTDFSPALHGHDAKTHEFITRSRGSYNQVLQAIKNLKELDQYIISNSVITKTNYMYLPKLANLLIELGVDQFQLAFIHAIGNAEKNFDLLVPKKSDVMPFVHKALDLGRENGIKMMVEAYPYCFMKGYEKYCSELYMPPSDIRDAEGWVEDFDKLRKETGKLKGPMCKECKYDFICEGPWKEYPEKFGWEEFKPVPGKKIKSPDEILNK